MDVNSGLPQSTYSWWSHSAQRQKITLLNFPFFFVRLHACACLCGLFVKVCMCVCVVVYVNVYAFLNSHLAFISYFLPSEYMAFAAVWKAQQFT